MGNYAIRVVDLAKQFQIGAKDPYLQIRQRAVYGLRRIKRSLFGQEALPPIEESLDHSFWALQDISFELKHGDTLAIVGRNGAGKSTLLKILSRITKPTRGYAEIYGRLGSLLEVGTGFHPDLSGRENIYLNATIMGMKKTDIQRKFDEIVAFAEIEKFIDTPVKHYSSGMFMRLAFAVAAHLDSEIMVIDEVLAVGDAAFQNKCKGIMDDANRREGRTLIFVSHNMVAVRQLCRRAILLQEGRILRDGSSAEIVDCYLEKASGERRAEQEYAEDINKPIQIMKVSVCNLEGRPADFVDLSSGFCVEIDYLFRQEMSNVVIGCSINAVGSEQDLISLSEPELDLSRLGKRPKGLYHASIKIPGNILNTGAYQVRVGAVHLHNVYDVVHDVVFHVVDNVGIVHALGYERKGSLLSLQLPWEVTKVTI